LIHTGFKTNIILSKTFKFIGNDSDFSNFFIHNKIIVLPDEYPSKDIKCEINNEKIGIIDPDHYDTSILTKLVSYKIKVVDVNLQKIEIMIHAVIDNELYDQLERKDLITKKENKKKFIKSNKPNTFYINLIKSKTLSIEEIENLSTYPVIQLTPHPHRYDILNCNFIDDKTFAIVDPTKSESILNIIKTHSYDIKIISFDEFNIYVEITFGGDNIDEIETKTILNKNVTLKDIKLKSIKYDPNTNWFKFTWTDFWMQLGAFFFIRWVGFFVLRYSKIGGFCSLLLIIALLIYFVYFWDDHRKYF